MKEPKQSILFSFIKYLKSLICSFKEDTTPLIKKREKKISYSEIPLPRGRSKGAKYSKLDLHRGDIVASLNNGETKTSIAKRLGTSPVNLHHWLKRRKIKISKKH